MKKKLDHVIKFEKRFPSPQKSCKSVSYRMENKYRPESSHSASRITPKIQRFLKKWILLRSNHFLLLKTEQELSISNLVEPSPKFL